MSSFILGSQLYENAFLNWFNTNLQFSFYPKYGGALLKYLATVLNLKIDW